MTRRIIKVRTTDYRPPGAGTPSPLERPPARPRAVASSKFQHSPGLSHWDRIEATMAAEHDKAVSTYSHQTATAALADLSPRRGNNNDPEFRWVRHRRAALQRKLYAPELVRKSA